MPPPNQVNEKEKLSPGNHTGQRPGDTRRARPAFLALLAGAVGIAFAPIFVRLSEVGPGATAFYRLFLALPILWVWRTIEAGKTAAPNPPVTAGDYWQLVALGFF